MPLQFRDTSTIWSSNLKMTRRTAKSRLEHPSSAQQGLSFINTLFPGLLVLRPMVRDFGLRNELLQLEESSWWHRSFSFSGICRDNIHRRLHPIRQDRLRKILASALVLPILTYFFVPNHEIKSSFDWVLSQLWIDKILCRNTNLSRIS